MSSSQYYLENHIDQFYRTIFFFFEVRACGIRNYADDIYDGLLPDYVMPESLQSIIFNDFIYNNYYLQTRRNLETLHGDSRNPIVKNIRSNVRIREENLIWLLKQHPVANFIFRSAATTLTTTTRSTSTTLITVTTTMQFRRTKKGSNRFNKSGKHFFCKQSDTTFSDNRCGNGNHNSNTKNSQMDSCIKQGYNNNETSSNDVAYAVCSTMNTLQSRQQMELKNNLVHNATFSGFQKRIEDILQPLDESLLLIKTLDSIIT